MIHTAAAERRLHVVFSYKDICHCSLAMAEDINLHLYKCCCWWLSRLPQVFLITTFHRKVFAIIKRHVPNGGHLPSALLQKFPVFVAWGITCSHPVALSFGIVHPDFSRLEELSVILHYPDRAMQGIMAFKVSLLMSQ